MPATQPELLTTGVNGPTPFDYREAKQIVEDEIRLLSRLWGLAALDVEREDLMQIGFVTLLEVGRMGAWAAIAVRHDFSDRLRSISGICRKHKAGGSRYLDRLGRRAAKGYVPLEPVRRSQYLTEVEMAADCERRLEKRNSEHPTEMACIQALASGETVEEIAKRLRIAPDTVWSHCHRFRKALF